MIKKKIIKGHTKRLSDSQKLRVLMVLEQCDMNYSEAARQTGLSRWTISNYEKDLWPTYLKSKGGVRDESLVNEAKKLIVSGTNRVVEKMDEVVQLAIGKIQERLAKDEYWVDKRGNKHYSVDTKDLVQLINVLSPYLADKRGVKGVDEKTPETGISTFVQNIRNAMLERQQINENNIEEGQADEIR
ncbi:MAG: hypothetical protein AB7V25_00340 [Mangrovibacterium sp.]